MSLEDLINRKDFNPKIIRSSLKSFASPRHVIENGVKTFILEEGKKNSCILQTKFVNKFSYTHKIATIVVCDFFIPNIKPTKILSNGWLNTSKSEYVSPNHVSVTNKLLMQRDYNFRSFDESYGYVKKSIVSEWYTEIVLGSRSLVIGAITTKDYFTQVFVKQENRGVKVRVTCQVDDISIKPGHPLLSEKIAIIFDDSNLALRKFSSLVSLHSKSVNFVPKEIKGLNCAYYDRGNDVDESYVKGQLEVLNSLNEKPNFDYIQLDAGYSNPWGDWFNTKKSFPSGLECTAKLIKKNGYKAGIWVAPFIASPESKLFKNKPHWFLKDTKENYVEGRGCSPFDGLGFLSFKVLDVTNKDVLDYVKSVARRFKSLGFDMIKVDFTYPIHLKNNYYNNKYTRAQIVRNAYQAIRDGVGADTLILSGISHLSPLVGIVNSARVGSDSTAPIFYNKDLVSKVVNSKMYTRNIRISSHRHFLNNVIWKNDADCVVFQNGTGLVDKQIREHVNFILENGLSRWVGDDLRKLIKQNKIKEVVNFINYN